MTENTAPELLAPCGSPETLRAAIAAGADAVYLGGSRFNARINAANFDERGIEAAVRECHAAGVRIYVTVNTLVYDREMNDVLAYVAFLYSCGVDALILADTGLACAVRRFFPDFEIHASTQMSGHNSAAAAYFAGMGFSRMVCARELSLKELKLFAAASPIELELFVHGALCVSHSGQCLISSVIGGRSGNRGECAQACRMTYNNSYPLSLRDNCLAAHLGEIRRLGIASLKIEGRMKSPDYVYRVTGCYRRLLDCGRDADDGELTYLADVFSRGGGFTDAYFTGKIGKSMLGVRTERDKAKTAALGTAVIKTDKAPLRREPIAAPERSAITPEKLRFTGHGVSQKPVCTARFLSADKIREKDYFDIIYLPLDRFEPPANGVILPFAIFDSELEKVGEQLRSAAARGAKHALVGNVGHITLAEKYGFVLHGDFRLNCTNNLSCENFSEFCDIILSPELTLPQIRDISCKKSVIVYGRLPIMSLEKRVGFSVLRDRRGVRFPVYPEGHRDVVYNSVPIYMADRQKSLAEAGIVKWHFIFTDENASHIVRLYKTGQAPEGAVKRIQK